MIDQKLKDYRAEFDEIITVNFTDKIAPMITNMEDMKLHQDNLFADLDKLRVSITSKLEEFTSSLNK